ncbi:MAG TPA: hypothetical protein VLA16_22235 [Ideonella sp.]|nr:hypothetical protein [Ideonella sp.]
MPADPEFDDEDTPFHLPMLGLYADLELGSGAVQLPDEFMQADPEIRRRILDDWLRGLTALRAGLPPEG